MNGAPFGQADVKFIAILLVIVAVGAFVLGLAV